jgi:hypothetical protein
MELNPVRKLDWLSNQKTKIVVYHAFAWILPTIFSVTALAREKLGGTLP